MSPGTTSARPPADATSDDHPTIYSLTAFQRDLLLAIAEIEQSDDEPKGLGVKRHLEEKYAEEVNHGRLYPNLDELTERGLVEKGTLDRRTNKYTLTDPGREALAHRESELAAVTDGAPLAYQ